MTKSDPISKLKSYKVGQSLSEIKRKYNPSHIYRLASNEIPAYRNKIALKALESLKNLHLYPSPRGHKLVSALSEVLKIPIENIALGAGASELIELLVKRFCNPLDPNHCVVFSKGSFIGYKLAVQVCRVPFFEVPYQKDMNLNITKLIETIQKKNPRLVFVANPNNPTGLCSSKEDLNKLMKLAFQKPHIKFVLDEAYKEFVRTKDTFDGIKLFQDHKNVVVLRTFSKAYGLAGLRIGYMVADEECVREILRIRSPFSVSSVAQTVAEKVLKNQKFMLETCKQIHKEIDYLYEQFDLMKLKYYKTQGNFIFIDPKKDLNAFYGRLLKEGLILRTFYDYPSELRMTVGSRKENEVAVKILKKVLDS